MMFIGEFKHTIDDKGRLALPAKFRPALASGCVITRGLDRCLWVYPIEEWKNLAEKISVLPITQKNARSFSRLMFAGATDSNPDRVGRVNLPAYLRDYAGLKRDVVVVGVYNRLEIWPAEEWENFKKEMEDNSSEVAENLSEIGF